MAKIPILTIGLTRYALRPDANVTAILKALASAELVDYEYLSKEGRVFFPATRLHTCEREVGIEYVDAKQIRTRNPNAPADDVDDDTSYVVPRRVAALKPATPLRLMGGPNGS